MSPRAAVVLLLLGSLGVPARAADPAGIDAYVTRKMADHLVPGLSLAVIENGAVVHLRGFGEMGPSSPIVIGSLSKAFTATAVLQLVDARKVDLDAPVRQYLPDFQLADPAAAAITVRQLLNQTSGIPTDAPRAARREASLADHVAALRETRLVAAPGTAHVYSSPSYQVLGRLVEVVSGQPFGAYVQEHVFQPLRMTRSTAEVAAARDLVPGRNIWWGMKGPSLYDWEQGRLPTASLISSAEDLARFLRAHLGGGELEGARILSPEAAATAHRGAVKSEGFAYAMGWREGPTAGVPSLWHGGALPSYRGALVMVPQTRSGVVVLSNSSSMFTDHTREIAAGVVAHMNGKPAPTGIRPLARTYQVIAAASLLLLGLQLRGLWRAARGPRLAAGAGVGKVIAVDLLPPVVLAAGIPRLAHIPWSAMLESAPDLVVASALLMSMSLATGLIRLARREPSRT
jgi:CubicO group peptidase (beta-lactamase class C family)